MSMRFLFVVVFALSAQAQFPSWVNVSPMNAPRHSHAAVTAPDSKIYVVGGARSGQCLASMERYNPLNNTSWILLQDMKVARCHPGAAVGADGLIYVVGGSTGSAATNAVERYDTATDLWQVLPPLNTARVRPGVAVGPDLRLYVLGGFTQNGFPITSIEVFDEIQGQWQTLSGVTVANAGAAVSGIDGDIYTFGVGKGAPRGRFDGSVWVPLDAVVPESLDHYPAVAGPDGYIYLPGAGIQSKIGSSLTSVYFPWGNPFSAPQMLKQRNTPGGAAAAEGRIFVSGGVVFQGMTELNQVEALGPLKAPVPDSTTAFFKFDEAGVTNKVADYAGLNTAVGVGGLPHHPGRVGRAVRFAGTRYVKVDDSPSVNFGTGDMSIEGWVRWLPPSNTNVVTTLIDKRTYSGGYQGYSVFFYKGRLGVQLANKTMYANYGGNLKVAPYEWVHIAISLDRAKNELSMFVNGVHDRTFVPIGGSTTNPAPLFIARHAFGGGYYNGWVDELTFYNRALTWAEVRGVFLAGREGKDYF